jgi:hypothetical protein
MKLLFNLGDRLLEPHRRSSKPRAASRRRGLSSTMRQRSLAAQLAELTGHPFVTAPNKDAAPGSLDAIVAGPPPEVRVNVMDITLPPVSVRVRSS